MGHGPASGRTETRKESARSGLRRTVRFLSSYNIYLQKYRPYSLRIATFSTGTFWSSARFREAAAGTPRNKESLFFILLRTAFSRTVPSQHSPRLHQINDKDICLLLSLGDEVGIHAGHLCDAFLLGGKNATVTSDNTKVTVNYRLPARTDALAAPSCTIFCHEHTSPFLDFLCQGVIPRLNWNFSA